MAKVVTEDGEGPNECPSIWVLLGRGHIDFSKEGALKAGEG